MGLADLGPDHQRGPVGAGRRGAGRRRPATVVVSCDSLRPDRFAVIRRRGSLAHMLANMGAAEAAGLAPVKVNVVQVARVDDDEILDFATFARRTGRQVRFIESLPLDGDRQWGRHQVVPARWVPRTIEDRWPLVPGSASSTAPVVDHRFAAGRAQLPVLRRRAAAACAGHGMDVRASCALPGRRR